MKMEVSHLLVIYDISEDRRRTDLADRLKLYGMTRIQKSAFISEYRPALLSEVKRTALRIINLETDNVQIYPLTPASYRMRITVGRIFKEKESDEGDDVFVI